MICVSRIRRLSAGQRTRGVVPGSIPTTNRAPNRDSSIGLILSPSIAMNRRRPISSRGLRSAMNLRILHHFEIQFLHLLPDQSKDL